MKTAYQRISGQLSRTSDVALLLARAILGWLVIAHALMKFQEKGGVKAFQSLLAFLNNVPFPTFTGAVLPWAELVLGIMLISGVLTRVAALLLTLEMLVIASLVKLDDLQLGVIAPVGAPSAGAELEFALIAGFLVLLLIGPGRVSVDRLLGLEVRGTAAAAPESTQVQAPLG